MSAKKQKTDAAPKSAIDLIDDAFTSQAVLNAALENADWDRSTKLRMRKEMNRLKEMMGVVLKNKDIPRDVLDGMEEVLVNTQNKLSGKPVVFKADMQDMGNLAA